MCAGVFVLLGSALAAANDRPILGILTQPESGNGTGTYIAASYVKFLESAGARVVPVHFDASRAELKQLFGSINGLLLPGGGADLSNGTLIHSAGRLLYDLAVAANDAGDTFPIWGTCMGFQFLSLLAARNGSVLCQHCYDTEGVALPLHFDEPAATKSRLYGHLPASLKQSLASEALTLNAHHDGIAPSTFASNARLAAAFDVLSTNVDGHGRAFVSSIEAKRYPFAGMRPSHARSERACVRATHEARGPRPAAAPQICIRHLLRCLAAAPERPGCTREALAARARPRVRARLWLRA